MLALLELFTLLELLALLDAWELLALLDAHYQIGHPATMRADSAQGYCVMGHQSGEIASGSCAAGRGILLLSDGTAP